MRWKSIKTVMIFILLGVNLWLVYLLAGRYMAQTYLGQDVLVNTVEILQRDGIVISSEQIDPKKRDADIYEAEMAEDYYDRVAEIFTASPIRETFPTPTGMRMIADNGDTMTFSGSFGVDYLAGGFEREEILAIAEFAVRTGDGLAPEQHSLRGLREMLAAALDSDTASGSGATVHAKLSFDAAWRFGDYLLFRCSQTLDGRPVGGHCVDCLLDEKKGELLWIGGTWSFLPLLRSYSAPLYDQINILFIEKAACLEARENDAEAPTTQVLDALEFCYMLNTTANSDGGKRVFYSPAWRIAYTDGTVRIYSAVTGEAARSE